MAQQKVQLRKLRDFGENFSDTFQFIRQEFKPLMAAFILVSGVFMLFTAILSGLYQKDASGIFSQLQTGVFRQRALSEVFNTMYFLIILFSMVTISAMHTVVAIYMNYYDADGESPTVQKIWVRFIKVFPKTFLFTIPVYLLMCIGLLFCALPGIYLAIVFAPFIFIVVDEEASFGEAFSRCFDLIKENFWISFAIYLVVGIIYSIMSGIIGLVIGLIIAAASYFTTKDLTTSEAWLVSVLSIVQYFFYVILFVSIGLHYYNLVEAKDGTGLAKRLEGLGNNSNPNENIEEQY